MEIGFRCRKRSMDGYVTISVADGVPACECGGSAPDNICDHLAATMMMQLEGPIHPDDRVAAKLTWERTRWVLLAGRRLPQSGWDRDLRWLGYPEPEPKGGVLWLRWKYGGDYDDRPKVCFTGDGEKPRDDYLREARERGWRAVDNWQPGIKVMVASDPNSSAAKPSKARAAGAGRERLRLATLSQSFMG